MTGRITSERWPDEPEYALAVPSFRVVVFGDSKNISKLLKLNDGRIWIINSEDNLHYFHNVVEYVMPDMQEELIEQIDMLNGKKAVQQFEMETDL